MKFHFQKSRFTIEDPSVIVAGSEVATISGVHCKSLDLRNQSALTRPFVKSRLYCTYSEIS